MAKGLTYDAGALLAGEANKRAMWALHRRALERGIRPVVPAGILGQAWRGGPQASLSRLLQGCRVEPLDEVRARTAGVACGRSGTADVLDATVVVGAIARGEVIVTSDPKDMEQLGVGLGVRVDLITV